MCNRDFVTSMLISFVAYTSITCLLCNNIDLVKLILAINSIALVLTIFVEYLGDKSFWSVVKICGEYSDVCHKLADKVDEQTSELECLKEGNNDKSN